MTEPNTIPSVGSQVGRYQFLREIAKGPFGPLYEVRAEADAAGLNGLGRLVTLPTNLEPEVELAITEAAWDSMELRHESMLCVADVVFGKGWVTLIHDYAEGSLLRSLQRRAQERQSAFPLAVAMRVVLDLLDGLERNRGACESAGIDWAPGGIGTTSLYLCGDGRTRCLDGQLMTALLRAKQMREFVSIVGFPAPELTDPDVVPDERADVFVAGAVLWEILAGRELSLGSAIAQGLRPRPKVPSLSLSIPKGSPQIPQAVVRIVNAALELDPAHRPQTLAELRKALTSDTEVATYNQVIDFTDALLHRESTLFRLTLDLGPRLSDSLHSERPKASPQIEWAIELAKNAGSGDAKPPSKVPRPAKPRAPVPTPSKPAASPSFVNRPVADRPSTDRAVAHKTGADKPGADKPLTDKAVAHPLHEAPVTKQTPTPPRTGPAPEVGKSLPKTTLLGMSPGPTVSGPARQAGATGAPSKGQPMPPSIRPKPPSKTPAAPDETSNPLAKRTLLGISPVGHLLAQTPSVALNEDQRKAADAKGKEVESKPTRVVESLPGATHAVEPEQPPQLAPQNLPQPEIAMALEVRESEPPTTVMSKAQAQQLLSATIEQEKVEIDRVRAFTAAAAAEPAIESAAIALGPVPAASRVAPGPWSPKPPGSQLFQLRLSTIIIGVAVVIAVAVLVTIVVLGGISNNAKAPTGAAVPEASVRAAVSASAAPPVSEPTTRPSASSEPLPSAAIAPSSAPPAEPAPTVDAPALSTASSKPPVTSSPVAPKNVLKKRRSQYVPNEL